MSKSRRYNPDEDNYSNNRGNSNVRILSKLDKDGNIPAGRECPFADSCIDSCPCNGAAFDKSYSCALARGLDLADRMVQERKAKGRR
jgi:hypothetical protein